MSSIVDSEALNRFLETADVFEARRVAAALDAMASAAHLAVVELETRSEQGGRGLDSFPPAPPSPEVDAVTRPTILWGVAADAEGVIHHSHVRRKDLGEGHYAAWKEDEWKLEPASAYAVEHPAPVPLRWSHGEQIGQVVASPGRSTRPTP